MRGYDSRIVSALQRCIAVGMKPPPIMLVSEHMEKYFKVTDGPEKGAPFRFKRSPFLREIVDCYNDPTIHTATVLKSSQVGITTAGMGLLFYIVDNDPKDILIVFPTGKSGDAEKWSKTRFSRALEGCPRVAGKFAPDKSRSSNSTIMLKGFHGGNLILAGANSPGALASNPCPVVIFEELARIAMSSGLEGDAQKIAEARASLFWDKFFFKGGSPTIKDFCPSEREFLLSDQRYYYIPCPACGEFQKLEWSKRTPEGDRLPGGVKWHVDADKIPHPDSAYYECEDCRHRMGDLERWDAIGKGIWIASEPFHGIAGFHIWQAYSMMIRLSSLASKFLTALKGGPETFQPFVNTVWGQTWEERGKAIEITTVDSRAEGYDAGKMLPEGVVCITAGMDIQDAHGELEIIGWGRDRESWSLDYLKMYGDIGGSEFWKRVHTFLTETKYMHPSGLELGIAATCIDSGGNHTQDVYEFAINHYHENIWCIKGQSQPNKPIIGHFSKIYLKNAEGQKTTRYVKLFPVGSDTAKDAIYSNLKVTEQGARYCHFPADRSQEYFDQLTSEKKISKKQKNGIIKWIYILPKGRKNEALDCRVYGLAALINLGDNLNAWAEQMENIQEAKDKTGQEQSAPATTGQPRRRRAKIKRSR